MGVKIVYHDTVDGCCAAAIVKNELVNFFDQQIIEYTRAGLYSDIEVYGTNENDTVYIIGIPMTEANLRAVDLILSTGAKVTVIDNHVSEFDYSRENFVRVGNEGSASLALLAHVYSSSTKNGFGMSDIEVSDDYTHYRIIGDKSGTESLIPDVIKYILDIGTYDLATTEWFERGLLSENHAPDAKVWGDLLYNNPRVIYNLESVGKTMMTESDRIIANDVQKAYHTSLKDDEDIVCINTTNISFIESFKKFFPTCNIICCFYKATEDSWHYTFSGVSTQVKNNKPKYVRELMTAISFQFKDKVVSMDIRDNNNGTIVIKELIV